MRGRDQISSCLFLGTLRNLSLSPRYWLLRCGRGAGGGQLGPRDQQDQRQRRDVRQDAGQARDPWVVVPLIEKFFA